MKNLFILLFAGVFFLACNKESQIGTDEVAIGENDISSVISVNFMYKGQAYTYDLDTITHKITGDEQAIQVLDALNANESVATLVLDDGSIEYFDSYEALSNSFKNDDYSNSISRKGSPSSYYAKLSIYKDTEYKGFIFERILTATSTVPDIVDLRNTGYDKVISSMVLQCYNVYNEYPELFMVTFYDGYSLTGYSISYLVYWSQPINAARRFTQIYKPNGASWNDEIKSFNFRVIR